MKDECEYAVGDKVTVFSSSFEGGKIHAIATVERISKRPQRIFLDAKAGTSEWSWAGQLPYRDTYYTGPWFRKHRQGDDEALRRARLLSFLDRNREHWNLATDAELEDAVKLLQTAKKRAPSKP